MKTVLAGLISFLFLFSYALAQDKKTAIEKPKAQSKSQKETVCLYAARLGKTDFLKQIKVAKTPTYEAELRKMFSVDSFSEIDKLFSLVGTDAIDISKVDLDRDGIMDYMLHRKEGSIQCGAVAVLLGRKDYHVEIAGVPDFNTCELTAGIYTHKNTPYLVFSTNNELSIQEIKKNKLSELCVL
ncbi:MAG: hypothetical protein JNM24_05975 [Bdellovibrionaceae bacterium]|nr:hypothetical protein [Pseudobdellovibrionaceae bacterium]